MLYQIQLPDYEYVAESIEPHDPSEIHGMLCGMLCLDRSLVNDVWLARLGNEIDIDLDAYDLLEGLFKATLAQIDDEEFSLMLLLPDDESNMSVRVESLGFWCQGFLTGLGLAGLNQTSDLSEEIQDFLNDVSHIARVGFDGDNPDEEDEVAYSDIVEYLRMGVLLIHEELCPPETDQLRSYSVH